MYKVFTEPKKEVSKYISVIVDGNTGLIVDQNGRFVKEQADEVLFWRPETLSRSYRNGSNAEKEELSRTILMGEEARELHATRNNLPVLDPKVNYIYIAHPFGRYVFGHFFDSLQRLFHTLGTIPKPWKVLHSRSMHIIQFECHLEKLGVEKDCLVELENNQAVVVPNLWVSPWQAPPAQVDPEIYKWIHKSYTQEVPKTKPLRLYLSRNHVRPGERGVTNEAEVLSYLKPHGFQTIRGDESLDETLKLFHNAEMIIAPHGSSLANTMFCNEDCRILEFCPDNRVDRSFKLKYKKAKVYEQILCPSDNGFNISIPLDEIEKFLTEDQN